MNPATPLTLVSLACVVACGSEPASSSASPGQPGLPSFPAGMGAVTADESAPADSSDLDGAASEASPAVAEPPDDVMESAPRDADLMQAEPEPSSAGSEDAPAEPPDEAPAEPESPPVDPGASVPSVGCSTANATPATGQLSIPIRGQDAAYLLTLPDGYDGSRPMPLVFGFHGRNRTHLEFHDVDASQIAQQIGSRAVLASLKSQGGTGWEGNGERDVNIEFFEALSDALMRDYCIDTSRVFVIGHSSGAHFTHILGCRYADRLAGLGVVAGAIFERDCVGPIKSIVIHGERDSQVDFSQGVAARDLYLSENGCGAETQPSAVAPCEVYQGCPAGLEVEWCVHGEPTYEDTNHGWPSFASRAMGEFFFGSD